ncbi:MAG TPA: hypothetical protein VN371_09730 [Chlorobaculum sp.]|nr:hypothetical protein [Chlorobaculum sp.]
MMKRLNFMNGAAIKVFPAVLPINGFYHSGRLFPNIFPSRLHAPVRPTKQHTAFTVFIWYKVANQPFAGFFIRCTPEACRQTASLFSGNRAVRYPATWVSG